MEQRSALLGTARHYNANKRQQATDGALLHYQVILVLIYFDEVGFWRTFQAFATKNVEIKSAQVAQFGGEESSRAPKWCALPAALDRGENLMIILDCLNCQVCYLKRHDRHAFLLSSICIFRHQFSALDNTHRSQSNHVNVNMRARARSRLHARTYSNATFHSTSSE